MKQREAVIKSQPAESLLHASCWGRGLPVEMGKFVHDGLAKQYSSESMTLQNHHQHIDGAIKPARTAQDSTTEGEDRRVIGFWRWWRWIFQEWYRNPTVI